MLRAIGFDIGDTLLFYAGTPLDWSAHYREALKTVARACGAAPSRSEFAAACQILSHYNTRVRPRTQEVAAQEIFSLILTAWSLEAGPHLETVVDSFFSFFQQRMSAFSETLTVLSMLNAAGMRLGALTDVPYGTPIKFVQRDLDRAQLSVFLPAVITSAMVGVRKPEVAGYYALAATLGVDPDEMAYVGNEPKDVIGAQRAGILSVFLDRAGGAPDHGQSFTMASLTELPDICVPRSNQARGRVISRREPKNRSKWTIETLSEKIKTTYTPPSCVRFFALRLITQPRDTRNRWTTRKNEARRER